MTSKKVLIVSSAGFIFGDSGFRNFVLGSVKAIKSLDVMIDVLSYNLTNNSENYRNECLAKDENHLINKIYLYDLKSKKKWMHPKNTMFGILFVLNRVLKKITKQKFAIHFIEGIACPGLNKFCRFIVNENKYDAIILFQAVYANVLKKVPNNIIKIGYLGDSQFIRTYYFQKSSGGNGNPGKNLDEELKLLSRFNRFAAISYDETIFYKKLINKDITFIPYVPNEVTNTNLNQSKSIDVLFVGTNNPFNIEGLRWFFNKVLEYLPKDINITIVGSVVSEIDIPNSVNINTVPYATELKSIYSNSKISICPLLHGTGMKIKVVEAMAYGIPVVCTDEGVSGFPDKTESGCLIANTPKEFAENIFKLLSDNMYYRNQSEKINKYYLTHFSQESIKKKWNLLINTELNENDEIQIDLGNNGSYI